MPPPRAHSRASNCNHAKTSQDTTSEVSLFLGRAPFPPRRHALVSARQWEVARKSADKIPHLLRWFTHAQGSCAALPDATARVRFPSFRPRLSAHLDPPAACRLPCLDAWRDERRLRRVPVSQRPCCARHLC